MEFLAENSEIPHLLIQLRMLGHIYVAAGEAQVACQCPRGHLSELGSTTLEEYRELESLTLRLWAHRTACVLRFCGAHPYLLLIF